MSRDFSISKYCEIVYLYSITVQVLLTISVFCIFSCRSWEKEMMQEYKPKSCSQQAKSHTYGTTERMKKWMSKKIVGGVYYT